MVDNPHGPNWKKMNNRFRFIGIWEIISSKEGKKVLYSPDAKWYIELSDVRLPTVGIKDSE